MALIETLKTGDRVELLYRDGADAARTKWYRGEVIVADNDTWPLVKLEDGQVTEVRPFMTWRMPTARTACT
jgi:hypothetical protein